MPSTDFPNVFQSLLNTVDKALKGSLIILTAAMVINVLWQVSTRFLFNDPSSFTEELARFLLVWIGMLGACHAYREKAHLGLDLVSAKLTGGAKKRLELFSGVAVIAFTGSVMIYGGGSLVLLTMELHQTSAALGLPMAYVYMVIPLSGSLISLYALDDIVYPQQRHIPSGSL